MSKHEELAVNVKYKDTLFKKLFGQNKENALSLYNAINGTNYTMEDDFEYTMMEDVLYLKMKDNERLYSTTLLRIPNPKFIVFYNGASTRNKTDVEKLKLSDAFLEKDDSGEFEWTVTMVNINVGHNKGLFEKCQVLEHYSLFIHRVRIYNDSMNDLKKAISKAVDECIREGILQEILETQKEEIYQMMLTEFDEEKYEAIIRAEGREEGLKEGLIKTLCTLVSKKTITMETALDECELTEEEFVEKMKAYGLDK